MLYPELVVAHKAAEQCCYLHFLLSFLYQDKVSKTISFAASRHASFSLTQKSPGLYMLWQLISKLWDLSLMYLGVDQADRTLRSITRRPLLVFLILLITVLNVSCETAEVRSPARIFRVFIPEWNTVCLSEATNCFCWGASVSTAVILSKANKWDHELINKTFMTQASCLLNVPV